MAYRLEIEHIKEMILSGKMITAESNERVPIGDIVKAVEQAFSELYRKPNLEIDGNLVRFAMFDLNHYPKGGEFDGEVC